MGSIAGRVDEHALVELLRAGDEQAFRTLVTAHHRTMTRVARLYVTTAAEAEEVVQEAWVGVLRGLDHFEQRSSLKTWMFRILVNCAKTRGVRERRSLPFSAVGDDAEAGPSVSPDRFRGDDNPWAGHWVAHPGRWSDLPEELLLARETVDRIEQAVDDLPAGQSTVMRLRDIDGWTAAEVCATLDITPSNQRVLLHRARSQVRGALESYLQEAAS